MMISNLAIIIISGVLTAGAIALCAILVNNLITKKRRLAKENLDRILEWYRYINTNLESDDYNWAKVDHKKYTLTKLPFHFYWDKIWTNYFKFHSQFKSNWQNVKAGERKYTMSDIEVPISKFQFSY